MRNDRVQELSELFAAFEVEELEVLELSAATALPQMGASTADPFCCGD